MKNKLLYTLTSRSSLWGNIATDRSRGELMTFTLKLTPREIISIVLQYT